MSAISKGHFIFLSHLRNTCCFLHLQTQKNQLLGWVGVESNCTMAKKKKTNKEKPAKNKEMIKKSLMQLKNNYINMYKLRRNLVISKHQTTLPWQHNTENAIYFWSISLKLSCAYQCLSFCFIFSGFFFFNKGRKSVQNICDIFVLKLERLEICIIYSNILNFFTKRWQWQWIPANKSQMLLLC